MAAGDRHQSHQRVHGEPRRASGDEEAGRREDHQYRLDDVHLRRCLRAGLRGLEGRDRAAHALHGHGLGAPPHQVNAVLPGWIDTELTINARREVPGLHERVLSRIPEGRWGTGDDMAGVAVFLASRASDYVTGTAIPVDGGYSIMS